MDSTMKVSDNASATASANASATASANARAFLISAAKVFAGILVIVIAAKFFAETLMEHSLVPDSWVPTMLYFLQQEETFKTSLQHLPGKVAASISRVASEFAESDKFHLLIDVFWTCLEAAVRLLFGARRTWLIKIFSFPARVIVALLSAGLSNYWHCKGATVALSFVIPFLPMYVANLWSYASMGLSQVSMMASDLDQWVVVPLLLDVSATAVLCKIFPQRIFLGIIAIRSLFYYALGLFVFFMTHLHHEETKCYVAAILWVTMSTNVVWMAHVFYDEENPFETKELVLKAGMYCCLWAAIWTCPWLGDTYFDFMAPMIF